MTDWATEASNYSGGSALPSAASSNQSVGSTQTSKKNEPTNRTEIVQSQLKKIYKKAVLPVEKRFRYDYFYESPFLSDVEFECKCCDCDCDMTELWKSLETFKHSHSPTFL
jgi:hypothetical protein